MSGFVTTILFEQSDSIEEVSRKFDAASCALVVPMECHQAALKTDLKYKIAKE
jgi:hypothetical protein